MKNIRINLSPEIIASIANMTDEIKDKDSLEIPNSNGLILVRMDSETYKEKEKNASIMFFEFNDEFCITSK